MFNEHEYNKLKPNSIWKRNQYYGGKYCGFYIIVTSIAENIKPITVYFKILDKDAENIYGTSISEFLSNCSHVQ